MEGRKGKYVGWNVPTEAVGSKTEDSEGIQLSKGVGWNWTIKSNTREPNFTHTGAIQGASYANPRIADRGGGIPIDFPTMRNNRSKV
jgi:hypothetical protein